MIKNDIKLSLDLLRSCGLVRVADLTKRLFLNDEACMVKPI